jgi:TatA/E family protein of Tat protein translocase
MFGLGTKEIIVIAVILILLFGSRRIPELAKGVTDAIKHLRGAFKDAADDDTTVSSDQKKKA